MGLHRWTGVPGRNDACHMYVIIATVGLYTTTRTLQTNRTDGINNKLSNAATNKPHGSRLDVVGLFERGPIHACEENQLWQQTRRVDGFISPRRYMRTNHNNAHTQIPHAAALPFRRNTQFALYSAGQRQKAPERHLAPETKQRINSGQSTILSSPDQCSRRTIQNGPTENK